VFNIELFNDDPSIFYSIAKDILPMSQKFSPTHAFAALLQQKGKLLTQYTQNIDNLEICAGIDPSKLIQCHGSFASATCVKCHYKVPGEEIFPELRRGVVAKCNNCLKLLTESSAAEKKRKRAKDAEDRRKKRKHSKNPETWTKRRKHSEDSSTDEEENNFREAGVMKPDITFFGEQLPGAFHSRLVEQDRYKCDLLICIGTSLKVAPVSEIIGFLPPNVPQIYISKTVSLLPSTSARCIH
jgi:NAD-dependent histone deacetylase SIR2